MSYQNNNSNWMENLGKNSVAQATASKAVAGVYGWMSFGVLLSAIVGVGLIQTNALSYLLLTFGKMMTVGVFLLQLALVFVMSFAANKFNSATLKALFLLYAAFTGFTFAIIMSVYPIGNVISIFFIAAMGFGALALFGAITKKNLGFMRTFLYMGLFMIIGAAVLNLFMQSPILRSFTGWAGILVFSGLTAYDSQRIREGAYQLTSHSAENTQAISKFMIFGALTMYLNFINLFISLLQIFGGRKE